jgi:hypothetical protein
MARVARGGLLAALWAVVMVAAPVTARGEQVYGVTVNDFLFTFDSSSPGVAQSSVEVSGLDANERVVAMDVQPGSHQLYALGSTGRLYTLDAVTGEATFIGRDFGFALSGSNGGMDFNAASGALQLVSSSDHSLLLDTSRVAAITQGGMLGYRAGDAAFGMDPNITQIASRVDGDLFGIDSGRNSLVRFGTLESGDVSTVGRLGIEATETGGFDISSLSGAAYAAFRPAGSANSVFYTIDLSTGVASPAGEFGSGIVSAIAVVPEPASAVLLAVGAAVFGLRRWKR